MIDTIFFDVGGVLLSKGWDQAMRKKATKEFALDDKFESRHERYVDAFERGQMSFDDYLNAVVFNVPRDFSRDKFREFIFAQQSAKEDSLKVLAKLSATRRYMLATLNNESRPVNDYRIERFSLHKYFGVFFSSCYVRERKPTPPIYQLAMAMTKREPDECLFVDDTKENIDTAKELGLHTILFESAEQLERELKRMELL